MGLVGYIVLYTGIVTCLLWIIQSLKRIESHLATIRLIQEKTDAGSSGG